MAFLVEEMKSVVESIQASRLERATAVQDVRDETAAVLSDTREHLKTVAQHLQSASVEMRAKLMADRITRSLQSQAALQQLALERSQRKADLEAKLRLAHTHRVQDVKLVLKTARDTRHQVAADIRLAAKAWGTVSLST